MKSTIQTIAGQLSTANDFMFAPEWEANINLYRGDHLTKPMVILLPYTTNGRQMLNGNFENSYRVDMLFLTSSTIDAKYALRSGLDSMTDLCQEFLQRLFAAKVLNKTGNEIEYKMEEVINMFDLNVDGVLLSVTLPVMVPKNCDI